MRNYADAEVTACQCVKCRPSPYIFSDFRYACEICGNKRCPHHSNHELACTGGNKPNQPSCSMRKRNRWWLIPIAGIILIILSQIFMEMR